MQMSIVYFDIGAESERVKTVEGEDELSCLKKLLAKIATEDGEVDEDIESMSKEDILEVFSIKDYDSGFYVHAIFEGKPITTF